MSVWLKPDRNVLNTSLLRSGPDSWRVTFWWPKICISERPLFKYWNKKNQDQITIKPYKHTSQQSDPFTSTIVEAAIWLVEARGHQKMTPYYSGSDRSDEVLSTYRSGFYQTVYYVRFTLWLDPSSNSTLGPYILFYIMCRFLHLGCNLFFSTCISFGLWPLIVATVNTLTFYSYILLKATALHPFFYTVLALSAMTFVAMFAWL